MNVLLLSMPDSFEHTATVTMRMPNGALASLAGNVDRHHRVAIADLILVPRQVRETVERLMREFDPDVVGLSVMTFQRGTARKIVALVRALKPTVTIVVGGYDPSLASDVYEDPAWDVDVIVRGEGDLTFRDLLRALEAGRDLRGIPGLSYRQGASLRPQPGPPGQQLVGTGGRAAEPRCSSAHGLHLHRPADRRRRNLARLHVRLQFLLDHRDARQELPHLVGRPGPRRHRRRARPGRACHLHRRRQHHAECRPVRGALPGHCRCGLSRYRLPGPGDDLLDRVAWRNARAADARSGVSLCLPGDREHPRRGSRVPQGQREERAPSGRPHGRQRDDGGDRACCIGTACMSSAD